MSIAMEKVSEDGNVNENESKAENVNMNVNIEELEEEEKTRQCKKLKKALVIRIMVRIMAIACMVSLVMIFDLNIHLYVEKYIEKVEEYGGPILSPFAFIIVASLWCGISPMGYLPTIIAGVTFEWYLSPLLAYLSINIGGLINIIWIRKVILKYQCCVRIFRTLMGDKLGKISYLENIISANPVLTVILIRLPYLNNGLVNYLLSLSSVSYRDNFIGNCVGFIPGSIVFSILGSQMRSLLKIVYQGTDDIRQLMLFLSISVVAIICYGILLWKTRQILSQKKGANMLLQQQQQMAGNPTLATVSQ